MKKFVDDIYRRSKAPAETRGGRGRATRRGGGGSTGGGTWTTVSRCQGELLRR